MPLNFESLTPWILASITCVATACAGGSDLDDDDVFGSFGTLPSTQGELDDEDDETGDATGEDDDDPSTGDDNPTGDGDGDGEPTTGDGDGDMPSCGDGQASGSEACDGPDLGGNSCTSLGYGGGALSCNADCTLNISGCTNGAACGNGVLDNGEVCDGAALNGQTCASQGFASGALACNPTCNGFNTTGCTNGAACGNGIIEGSEVCDGAALNGQSCATVGFAGGNLTCLADCSNFSPAGCHDGNCCVAIGNVGCQVPFVENCVCNLDPWCCAVEWDDACVLEAVNDCAAAC